VGVPQVFIRLCGCNLRCSYCDTPGAREKTEYCRVYDWDGGSRALANPLEAVEVSRLAASTWSPFMHSVSLTGGEPLLQRDELELLLPLLKEEGMPVYLETNGTLWEGLEAVLRWLDFIAMDIKLPSSQEGRDLVEEHRRFLRIARSKQVFLKAVVDKETEEGEIERACRILSDEVSDTALVLQPATPRRGEAWVTPLRIAGLYRIAAAFFPDVRVIPQTHHVWGVR
jgi:7-carboxy-7-deazaguanine synthase